MQKKTIIIAAIVLLVAVIGGNKVIHYTSHHEFCQTCHDMKVPVKAWAQSPHKDVECMNCHSNGTLGSYLTAKVSGLGHLYAVATNAPKHFRNPKVENRACLNCHAENLDFSGRYDHSKVLEKGTNCVYCHAPETHGIIQ